MICWRTLVNAEPVIATHEMMQNLVRPPQRQRRYQQHPQATPAKSMDSNTEQDEPVAGQQHCIDESNRRLCITGKEICSNTSNCHERCLNYKRPKPLCSWHVCPHFAMNYDRA